MTSSSSRLSGVQRHGINLATCLLTQEEITSIHLVAAPWQRELVHHTMPADPRLHLHFPPVGRGPLSRNHWFYYRLPTLATELAIDLIHFAYPMPVNRHTFRCPIVVTLHDCYPYDIPENFGFPKVFFNRAVLQQCLKNVDSITCVSASTLASLKTIASDVSSKAQVIFNSVLVATNRLFSTPPLNSQPFLLCVAQHRRNKNVLFVLQVFQRLFASESLPANARLVIIGISGPETPSIKRYISKHCLAERVLLLNGISDESLGWCYRNCLLLLAPSTIEGFGLPVVEALMSGCRVLCSDIPAFREVGAGHCRFLLAGQNDLDAWSDAACTELLRTKPSPVDMPWFGAASLGEQYLRLYQKLLVTSPTVKTHKCKNFACVAERHHIS